VNRKPLKNIAASIRQKILNKSRKERRTFMEQVQYYAMNRFLYRLSLSPHSGNYILKGALLLKAWNASISRPTKDIDFLGKTENNEHTIANQVRDICRIAVEPDGLVFDTSSIQTRRIKEGADYEGIHVQLSCKLGTVRINILIDIGFGDIVHPKYKKVEIPSILDLPSVILPCYSKESIIAEKFEAMIKLGDLNSRMKDFYDIWFLINHYNFHGKTISEAIRKTFIYRKTVIPEKITAFSDSFIQSKTIQWNAFIRKFKQEDIPSDFKSTISQIRRFFKPILKSIREGTFHKGRWISSDPWE